MLLTMLEIRQQSLFPLMNGMRLVFDENAFEDLAWWMSFDSKKARKVISLSRKRNGAHLQAEVNFTPLNS